MGCIRMASLLSCWMLLLCEYRGIASFSISPISFAKSFRVRSYFTMTNVENPAASEVASAIKKRSTSNKASENAKHKLESVHANQHDYQDSGSWEGYMEGFDWQLEQARRVLEGPSFAPIRSSLWQPILGEDSKQKKTPPGIFDTSKILLNNAFQLMGLAESLDGAPLVQGVNTFKGSPLKLLSRVLDGNLQELAGGPLFLLLHDYYEKYGPIYKLAFGPKSFMVVSDPIMVKHILKVRSYVCDNYQYFAHVYKIYLGRIITKFCSMLRFY